MAITSIDQIAAAISAGQQFKYVWNKQTGATTAYVAGRWYSMETLPGSPAAETYTTLTASTSYQLTGSNVGWMPTGGTAGAVSPLVKNLTGVECITSSSTGVPAWLMLVDMLMVYPNIPLTAGTTALTTNVALPRYANGQGVMMYLELSSSTGVAANLNSSFTYNNTASASHTVPGTVALNTASAFIPLVINSGTSANNFGPFLPLATGDTGVLSASSFGISATGAGTAHLILCKPLAQIPLTQQYYPSGRDFVFNMPSMPVIYDGAYLNFLLYAGAGTATNSQFNATLDYVWG